MSREWIRRLVWALALIVTAAACEPRETFVLLPEGGRAPGSIAVTGGGVTRGVDASWEAIDVGERGEQPSLPFRYRTSSAARQFGAALDQQPLPPTLYILHFETGTENLTEASSERIVDVFTAIRDRRWPDVGIVGHSDRVGDEDESLALSLRRAEAVRDILVSWGIDPDILEVDSHGEYNPLVPNVPEPGNRRVEVTVR